MAQRSLDVAEKPEQVKAALNLLSGRVEELNGFFARSAEQYGVVGDLHDVGGNLFRITKDGDAWGVYCASEGPKLRLITGCRVDVKLAFLKVAPHMATVYRNKLGTMTTLIKSAVHDSLAIDKEDSSCH